MENKNINFLGTNLTLKKKEGKKLTEKEYFTDVNKGDIHLFDVTSKYPIFFQKSLKKKLELKDENVVIKVKSIKDLPTDKSYFIFKILVKKLITQIVESQSDSGNYIIQTSLREIRNIAKEFNKDIDTNQIKNHLSQLSETNYNIQIYSKNNKLKRTISYNIIDTFDINHNDLTNPLTIAFSSIITRSIKNINYITTYYDLNMNISYGAERIVYLLMEYFTYFDIKENTPEWKQCFTIDTEYLYDYIGINSYRKSDRKKQAKKYITELSNPIKSFGATRILEKTEFKKVNKKEETLSFYPTDFFLVMLKKKIYNLNRRKFYQSTLF